MPTDPDQAYENDAFEFNKQATQVFVQEQDGTFTPLQRSDLNPQISSTALTTAFGENAVAMNFPYIQGSPTNNSLPVNFRTFTLNGGSATVENSEFKVNTNTTVGAYGVIQSFRSLNYKPGMGGLGRFTARFASSGVANSQQGVGFLNLGDELSFGYSGTEFGIWYRHHGLAEIRKLTITNGAGGGQNATVTIDGTGYLIPITAGTTQVNAYEIATNLATGSGSSNFNAWQNSSDVYISFKTDGAKTGNFAFSASTASGTWSAITTGVTKISEFIAQNDWNVDTRSELDTTKGNVYQVEYQYLGYGNITFSIENPETSQFQKVHVLKYSNSNTRPSLGNPSLKLGLYAVSFGSASNIEVYSACVAGFSQGLQSPIRNPRSFFNTKSIGTTLTNIFTLRNKIGANGRLNQSEMEPKFLTVFTNSAQGALIQVRTTPSVTGPTNFQDVSSSSFIEYDTTGTTTSENDGIPILSIVIPGDSSQVIDLESLRIRVPPSLVLCVAGKVIGGAASNISAALVWYEDI